MRSAARPAQVLVLLPATSSLSIQRIPLDRLESGGGGASVLAAVMRSPEPT